MPAQNPFDGGREVLKISTETMEETTIKNTKHTGAQNTVVLYFVTSKSS